MKRLLLILILSNFCIAQQTISTEDPPCYSYKHITIPAESVLVEAAIAKNLYVKKEVEIIFREEEVFYFYKKILYRIEVKNKKLDCPFDKDGFYIDNDIVVCYDTYLKKTSITDYNIWGNLVRNKNGTFKKKN